MKPHREEKLNRYQGVEDLSRDDESMEINDPMVENENENEPLSEGDDNGDENYETDPEDVDQPEDYSQEDFEDEPIDMQYYQTEEDTLYQNDDLNEEYNFGYNEPSLKSINRDSQNFNDQWHDDINAHDQWDSESSKQESEDSESEDDDLKEENKYNKNNFNKDNKIIRKYNSNDIVENDNRYLTKYNDDGVNKTVTYKSVLDNPEMQGRAKLTLHRTRNSKGYHFEAQTNYSNEYQPVNNNNKKRLMNSDSIKTIEPMENLPVLTIGNFYKTKLEEEEGYETESKTESLEDNYPDNDVPAIPEGHTNVTTEAVGNSSEKSNPLRHTSENEEHLKTEIVWIKEERLDEDQPRATIANDAWRTTNAMREINIKPIKEERDDTNSLSDTISMHSGSDSQYTELNDPRQIFIEKAENDKIEIKQEMLEEDEVLSIDTSYNPIIKVGKENHLPMVQSPMIEGESQINHPTTRISEEDGEETSRKMDTDTSEDISKLPKLPEDDDQGQPNDSRSRIKLTCKTKNNGYITKRNKRSIRKKLIEIEYHKTRIKFKKHYISYLQRYLKWIRVELDKINAKMSDRVVTNDKNNERALSYGKLVIQRGETTTVKGIDQSQDGTQKAVGEQTTPAAWRVTTVIRQPLHETCVVTRGNGKSVKVAMEARTVALMKRYREKCERRDNQRRYRERIAHLEKLIEDIPDVDEIPVERERQLELELDRIEQEHNQRDNATRLQNSRDRIY